MTPGSNRGRAVDVLQELGLSSYESQCFVGLVRLSTGTAKQVSEVTDVPRTRVYDSMKTLEEKGLIEVQHSTPRKFRSVAIDSATATLRGLHENRLDRLRNSLRDLDPIEMDARNTDGSTEVWSLCDERAIENRILKLIEGADEEIVMVVGDQSFLGEAIVDGLAAIDEGISVHIGAADSDIRESIRSMVSGTVRTVEDVPWLDGQAAMGDADIGRLLVVDRRSVLVSSVDPDTGGERAIFGRGRANGLVVVSRRLLETGRMPGSSAEWN